MKTQRVYLYLVGGNTLATSFIWGINTLFLLDAGLSNFEAFWANAFFSIGQVIFEIPTGIVADIYGRRLSYLLGALTLTISTILYFLMWEIGGPFIGWAFASIMLGLGFTFFSGALEAWLVDALSAENEADLLEEVFERGQVVSGAAMLFGSVAGGVIAQITSLGVPYILRALVLIVSFVTAFVFMRDKGFSPKPTNRPFREIKNIFSTSIELGFKNRPVRWIMLAAPFTTGVSFYIFYALQPFLLKLYGDEKAYGIAGIVAATVALAQISGGLVAPNIKKLYKKRTSVLLTGVLLSSIVLILISISSNFWIVFGLIFIWGLMSAATTPIRQTYLNGNIPTNQRATLISFDSLMGSSGGIFVQPVLGKLADISSYATTYFVSAIIQSIALPFIWLSRRQHSQADIIKGRLSPN